MNPKNLNDLDPKLREAYEKVMGTNFNPAGPSAEASNQTPSAQPQSQPLMQTQPADEPTPAIQTIPTQPPAPANPTPSPLPSQNPFVQTPEPPPTVFTQTDTLPKEQNSKKLNFMPIIFVIGGAIFFAAYAVIWAKLFGLF